MSLLCIGLCPHRSTLHRDALQLGGLGSFTPSESSRMLWSFATLGHTPTRLLQGLSPNWSWQLPPKRKMPKGAQTKGVEQYQVWSLRTTISPLFLSTCLMLVCLELGHPSSLTSLTSLTPPSLFRGHTRSDLHPGVQLSVGPRLPGAGGSRSYAPMSPPCNPCDPCVNLCLQVDTAPFQRAWQEVKARGPSVYLKEGDIALTQIWQVGGDLEGGSMTGF